MKSTPSGEMHRKHHSIGAEVSQANQDRHDRERQTDLQSQDCHDRQRQISANQDRHDPQVEQPRLRGCGSTSKGSIKETKPDKSETKRTKYEGARMPLFVFLQRQKVSVHKAAVAAVLCMKMPPGCDRFALRQCLRRGCSCSPVWGSPTPPTVDRWRKDVKCEPPPNFHGEDHAIGVDASRAIGADALQADSKFP